MDKIAIFLPSLCGGGAERVMLTLANGIAARGVPVDLVLARAEGPYLTELDPGVRVVDLDSARVSSSLLGLVRYLRRERPQSMLSALNHANVVAVVARMLSGVNVRLLVGEHNNVSTARTGSMTLRDKAVLPLMRWAYRHVDGVVAVSNGVADDLAKAIAMPRDRISVIYNPVVTPELLAKAREPLQHQWLEQGTPPVILGVGRLTEQKNFSLLISAFAQVRKMRECKLVILGEGELRPELEALVRQLSVDDDVLLPGFSDKPFAWMGQVSLFVLSSGWEGLPTVLIEAMACGAPVVSTDCPSGPDEILEGGRWGYLVPVGDVSALAEAMNVALGKTAIEHPDVRARASYFSTANAVEQYLAVMRDAE